MLRTSADTHGTSPDGAWELCWHTGTVARTKSRNSCLRAERLLLPTCISVHHSLTHSQTHRAERTNRAGVLTAPLLAAIMLVSAAHAVWERGRGCQPVLNPCSSRTNFSTTPSAGVAGVALRFCSPFNYTSLQISWLELGAADKNAQGRCTAGLLVLWEKKWRMQGMGGSDTFYTANWTWDSECKVRVGLTHYTQQNEECKGMGGSDTLYTAKWRMQVWVGLTHTSKMNNGWAWHIIHSKMKNTRMGGSNTYQQNEQWMGLAYYTQQNEEYKDGWVWDIIKSKMKKARSFSALMGR